jgi:multiple sugar transport system permease protein
MIRSHIHFYILRKLIVTILFWGLIFVIVAPLIWMIISSLKLPTEIVSRPPTLYPNHITMVNYKKVIDLQFRGQFMNSMMVATATTLFVMLLSTFAAYSLTRFNYPGRILFSRAILFTYLFPSVLMVVPLFVIFNKLSLVDTLSGLVLAYVTISLPFSIWMMRAYLLSIPISLEESAMVDGASRISAFIEIVLPQTIPGLVSIGVFTFMQAWNEYLIALVFISNPSRLTLPVGISYYANQLDVQWGPLMAISTLVSIPVILIFSLGQKFLVQGIGSGGLKG